MTSQDKRGREEHDNALSRQLNEKEPKMIERHHRYDMIGGLRIFFCLTFEHAYETRQNFDYCPSCGKHVKEVKELI